MERNESHPLSTTQQIEQLISRIDHLFTRLMLSSESKPTANEIETLIARLIHFGRTHPDTMIGISRLRSDLRYSVTRAIQNSLFSLLLADQLQWSDEPRIVSLCSAALTEQFGLYPMRTVLTRQAAADSTHKKALREHQTENTLNCLQGIGVDDPLWLKIIQEHAASKHTPSERYSEACQLLQLVDRYGAMMSTRGLRSAQTTEHCFEVLNSEYGAERTQPLLDLFGDYLPGSSVILENRAVAIVTQWARESTPIQVAAICSAGGEKLEQPEFHDANVAPFQIQQVCELDWTRHVNCELLWPTEGETPSATLFQFSGHAPV